MYCINCSKELIEKDVKGEGSIPYCPVCDKLYFEKSSIAMIAIVVNPEGQICLTNQNKLSTYKVLIAGYLKVGETIEDCVKREVQEEIGVRVSKTRFLKSHFYDKNKVLMMGFVAYTDDVELVIDQDEVDCASWYDVNDCLWRIREGSIAYLLVKQYINEIEGDC